MANWFRQRLSRRTVLASGIAAAGTSAIGASGALGQAGHSTHVAAQAAETSAQTPHGAHGAMVTVGDVDNARNGFDPTAMLTDWETGSVSTLGSGQTLRTFEIVAEDKEIEIAPGLMFPAWTYNGRIPGPTLRATEGDRLRIVFKNFGSHPHSMHFHGIHAARMDGVPGAGMVDPGDEFVYEFDAKPFGCHLYHCHALPLKRHLHKGMYGAFIVDPDPARHPEYADVARSRLLGTPENRNWQELVMVMNAFAHCYMKAPIRIARNRPVRIYLVNVIEFDPINSFHLHANFFDYFDQGTTLTPTLKTVDLIVQCQAQRGILEFTYRDHEPGLYMFHPHQSEFTELGWVGMFDVVEDMA
jgi:FtsP/CotA-like multicopper oxidase with cupredoxin domain